jgi:hypothetical protein
LILVNGALVDPAAANDHRVRAGRAEGLHQFVIGLQEFLALNGSAVVYGRAGVGFRT